MTPDQIKIVRLTFAQTLDRKVEIGMMFYERLFAIAPDTRAMFKSDIEPQSRKLMDMLSVAIGSLRDPATLKDMLVQLGNRHIAYGVTDTHYEKVGEALLWTLAKEFGDAFTPQVRDAWATMYTTVATTMKGAAASASGSASARRAAG